MTLPIRPRISMICCDGVWTGSSRWILVHLCAFSHILTAAKAHPSPRTLYIQVADGTNLHIAKPFPCLSITLVQVTWITLIGGATLISHKIAHHTRSMTLGRGSTAALS